ncbi:MAG: TRAP transporter TatT component family protein [Leptospiraceae bacterium]|nr:TRAP transporter TatT component family protein [Leptospiraceae bacterium]
MLRAVLCGLLLLTSTACSIKKMAVRQAAGFFSESRKVFETETDLELAETAIAANLKLLEAMQVHDPENAQLNLLLAEVYSVFTLSFIEDKMEEAEAQRREAEKEHQRRRAIALYLRARDFAARALLPRLEVDPTKTSEVELQKSLARLSRDDVAAVFWYAFAWGAAINLDRENVEALSELPKIEILMAQVKNWDEGFYFGGAWLFEGIYFGARSELMGGNPERAKAAFEQNLKLTEGKMLITRYFYARTYCIFTQNQNCFEENLRQVLSAPPDIHPAQKLANALAKKKAQRLLKRRSEFFVD